MKRKIQIILAVGLVAALFMAVSVIPALAEEGGSGAEAMVRPPGPCTLVEIRRTNIEIAEAARNKAWDKYYEKYIDWINAIDNNISDSSPALWRQAQLEFGLVPTDCIDIYVGCDPLSVEFGDATSCYHQWIICLYKNYIHQLKNLERELRESGDTERADRALELREAFRSKIGEEYSTFEAMEEAWNEYEQADASVEYFEARLNEAEIACANGEEWTVVTRPRNGRGFRPRMDMGLVEQMQNPMGSDDNQSNNRGALFTPFIVLDPRQATPTGEGQTAAPEVETPTKILPRVRLIRKLPEGLGTGKEQPAAAATAETMQVEQPGSTNTGTNTFGYTHMRIPQNTGKTGATAAPIKALKIHIPKRPIRFVPGRSFKR